MKKKFLVVLCVTILALAASIVTLSATDEPTFNFALAIDGKTETTAATGDIVTVSFVIERTDANESYKMSAFQNEIRYDSTFLELVDGSITAKDGIKYQTNIKVTPYHREQYFNHLGSAAGTTWDATTDIATFQFRVIAESGASLITNEDCIVSRIGANGSYTVTDNDVLIVVSNALTVTFDTGEGSEVAAQTVNKGDKLVKPADPTREAYIFTGWYTDVDCNNAWNFDDAVQYNVHLYAGWNKDKTYTPDTPDEPAEELPFVDVTKADWFYDYVYYAWKNGLMKGTSDTVFSPDRPTTRAMIVTIIHRFESTPASTYAMKFGDVEDQTWYTESVRWAAENEIVMGYDEFTFKPNQDITREQMVAILWRYAKYKGYDVTVADDVSLDGFTDASSISPYAVEAMRWAYDRGLIQGMGNGTIAPTGNATRAQVATIFMRFRENIK